MLVKVKGRTETKALRGLSPGNKARLPEEKPTRRRVTDLSRRWTEHQMGGSRKRKEGASGKSEELRTPTGARTLDKALPLQPPSLQQEDSLEKPSGCPLGALGGKDLVLIYIMAHLSKPQGGSAAPSARARGPMGGSSLGSRHNPLRSLFARPSFPVSSASHHLPCLPNPHSKQLFSWSDPTSPPGKLPARTTSL